MVSTARSRLSEKDRLHLQSLSLGEDQQDKRNQRYGKDEKARLDAQDGTLSSDLTVNLTA